MNDELGFDGTTRDGKSEIYVINADGSGKRRLTRTAGQEIGLAWSPDGRKLAFTSNRRAGNTSKNPRTSRWVASLISTIPGSATDCRRWERLVVSPIAVYSILRSLPTVPTTTGPVWTPMRTRSSTPLLRSTCALRSRARRTRPDRARPRGRPERRTRP